jgi:signal transduction histidine kinase/DNA-binding response OmpR family regulator/ligand-binding sensor domain-containing protein
LAQASVQKIVQDSFGRIWIGTTAGLSVYNGYDFKNYLNNLKSHNHIYALLANSSKIWIGNREGFAYLNFNEDKLVSFPSAEINTYSNRVFDMLEDENNDIWIAAYPGLYRIKKIENYKTDLFYLKGSCLSTSDTQTYYLPNQCSDFRSVAADPNSKFLWLGSSNGLFRFNKKTLEFKSYQHAATDSSFYKYINFIYTDKNNRVWVGANNKLFRTEPDSDSFKEIVFHSGEDGKGSAAFSCMIQLSNGDYWLGTISEGLWIVRGDRVFRKLVNNPRNQNSISSGKISCIFEAKNKTVFVGNSANGVDIYREPANLFYHFPDALQNGLSSNFINSVSVEADKVWTAGNKYPDLFNKSNFRTNSNISIENPSSLIRYKGRTWVGKGASVYELSDDHVVLSTYKLEEHPKGENINKFIRDGKDQLWVLCKCSVYRYNESKKVFEKIIVHGPDECTYWRFASYDGYRNWIWLGTHCYLVSLDLNTGIFNDWQVEKGALDGIYDYSRNRDCHDIEDLKVDKKGILWAASKSVGLLKIEISADKKTKVRVFDNKRGLVNNDAVSVLLDKKGLIWVPTTAGLSCFDPLKETFTNFTNEFGLPSNHHNPQAYFQTADEIFLGTNNGLYAFNPEKVMQTDALFPKVIIDVFELNNKEVKIDSKEVLSAPIFMQKKLELTYTQKVISFGFSAMDYRYPNVVKYAYKLEGFDNDWIITDAKNRKATYTSLPAGKYTFKIKASNRFGVFGESYSSIIIIQHPPFWSSRTAYFLYLISIIAVVIIVIKTRENRLKSENKRLEKQVNVRTEKIQLQSEELRNLDKLKSRFFANVSHELRTPLTLILGHLGRLRKQLTESEYEPQLKVMERNSRKLLGLVEEILDLSKLEAEKLETNEEPTPFLSFIRRIFSNYESAAAYNAIDLKFYSGAEEEMTLLLDRKKIEKILDNLLSNALKFTQKGGSVTMSVSLSEDFVGISVSDSGEGIHPDDLPYIFDRFYQSRLPEKRAQGGTGIGLALSMELATLLGGDLNVESALGKGSTFVFEFPKKLVETAAPEVSENDLIQTPMEQESAKKDVHNSSHNILIVEDHPDMRAFVQSIVGENYNTFLAVNGQEALDILEREKIDFIISDVMMPVMDGFQLLEKLKGEDSYRHIPVLMLTARAAAEDRLQALRIGVDDYLTKPFVAEELMARIRNLLINYNERLRWAQGLASLTDEAEENVPDIDGEESSEEFFDAQITQEDQIWLSELESFVKNNCKNNNLSVDWISSEMNVSTRQLQRRLKKITGLTPKKYINEVRLQIARELLETQKYKTISQVAYHVGFQKVNYFTQLFTERFGVTPSDYLENKD